MKMPSGRRANGEFTARMRSAPRGVRQSLLMSFSAANLASDSDAWSSGVTILRTVSPPTTNPGRTFRIMAARQCPGFRS
jgi:hypothetical protein